MKTYVINLQRATARRAAMEAQLASHRMDYEFVQAVDGRQLPDHQRSALVDEAAVARYPSWLTPGAIGCILSHKLVYERVVAREEAAFVVEDDALLPDDLGATLAQMAPLLPDDGVILLNFRSLTPCKLMSTALPAAGKHEFYSPVDPRQPVSTLAYLVGPEAASRMAEMILPVRFAADSWGEYAEASAISSLLCVLPRPVMPMPLVPSTIRYGGRSRIAETFPIRQLRRLNRSRIVWLENRVEIIQ